VPRSLIALLARLLAPSAKGTVAWRSGLFVIVFMLRGALPLAAAYALRLVLDSLGSNLGADAAVSMRSGLVWLLIGWGALMWGAYALAAFATFLTEEYSRAIQRRVQEVVDAKSVALDLSWFEDSRFHDALHRAQHDASARLPGLFQDAMDLVSSLFGLVMVAAAFLIVQPLGFLLFLAVPLPVGALVLWQARHHSRRLLEITPLWRQLNYLHHLLASRSAAKEVRLLELGPVLAARAASLWDLIAGLRTRIAWWRFWNDVLISGAVVIGVVIAGLYFVREAVAGLISLGSVVMYVQWLQRAEGAVRTVQRSLSGIVRQGPIVKDLAAFNALESSMADPECALPMPATLREALTFRDVSFKYPESGRQALHGVTCSIPAGRTIALVGPNGSGKTTLVKLLCRLHDPTSGEVAWDGVDLRRFRAADVRRRFAAAFQDFQRYEFTVRDNIWVGDTSRAPEDPAVEDAVERAGATQTIQGLPKGYDTQLGKLRFGGEDLSAGEWQSIALARAFMRDCPIIVLDEPTSALDVAAEARLFERFVQHARGRTAVFVSHRFSTVRDADWIVVLMSGRIIEQGTHDSLMSSGGHYAKMFELQVSRYRLSTAT
jgi:ATP-binding cassette subfamily B protein